LKIERRQAGRQTAMSTFADLNVCIVNVRQHPGEAL